MTPRAGNAFRTSEPMDDLAVTRRHAAGIDVHAAVHLYDLLASRGLGRDPGGPASDHARAGTAQERCRGPGQFDVSSWVSGLPIIKELYSARRTLTLARSASEG